MSGSDFGATLAQLRTARGISMWRLGRWSGVSEGLISRYERGQRLPNRVTILRLATALTCTAVETDNLLASAGFLPIDVRGWLAAQDESEAA